MGKYAFEDRTCSLGRYTAAYFDCAKKSSIVDDKVYAKFKNDLPFPVFTGNIFKSKPGTYPIDLFDYKERTGLRNHKNEIINPGRIIVLKRKNTGRNTNFFYIWISDALWSQFVSKEDGKFGVNVHVIFHPAGHIAEEYPNYYDEKKAEEILKQTDPATQYWKENFFELGIRYLFHEKQSVLQHRSAILRSDANPDQLLQSDKDGIPIMLIIPVSGVAPYFGDLGEAPTLKEAISEISNFCFEIAQASRGTFLPVPKYPDITRIACSFYSFSGAIAERLLERNPDFINEFYLYDVKVDKTHKVDKKQVIDRTQEQGFSIVWKLLKNWKKDDPDRKLRIYSAYPTAILPIATQLRSTSHDETPANFFSLYENKPDRTGSGKYSGLTNGYEIYNNDKSISLVSIPLTNFNHYFDKIKNPGGFVMDDNYMAGDTGHSWFIRRLQTHSIYYSGFVR